MEKDQQIRFAGIIPARYASSRFPGKPLAMLGNKTMIRRVYEQASQALDQTFVATDDARIYEAVKAFGGNVIMTSPHHMSGTDRCAEAVIKIQKETGFEIDVAINIQGDEPFIKPQQITVLKDCFEQSEVEIATLIRQCEKGEDIFNPNQPKVIINKEGYAIYFSRATIPYLRDIEKEKWADNHPYFKHIGLYAYRTGALRQITSLKRSSLEIAESLEQNRWIESGFRIKTALTSWESIGIDTPEDLEKAKIYLNMVN